ncbi:MAG: hypothetical protein WAS49_07185 [Candidatus Dechloromonas phosphoritropha]|jgi:hypothetical protein|nr:hypothetical protein [Candidatus Dechloromonas phosphoritropha]MBP8788308.1 hypothetical protein [Azonexus sp.]
MNELLKQVLQGRSVERMLRDEASAIKRIGATKEEKTFAPQKSHGFVTGKIIPVPKSTA